MMRICTHNISGIASSTREPQHQPTKLEIWLCSGIFTGHKESKGNFAVHIWDPGKSRMFTPTIRYHYQISKVTFYLVVFHLTMSALGSLAKPDASLTSRGRMLPYW